MELCECTSDSWREWRDLRLRALSEAAYAFTARLEDWQGADESRWRQRLDLAGSYNLIAWLDGHPVAMVSGVSTEDPRTRALIGLWVAPDARGKGAGDALTAAVARWAREQGAEYLRLDVKPDNIRAIALYARHGFVGSPFAEGDTTRRLTRQLLVDVDG